MSCCTKLNLLMTLGVSFFMFSILTIPVGCLYTPSYLYKDNAEGQILTYPPYKINTKYTNLDALTIEYCNLNMRINKKSY